MKIIETIKRHANIALALGVMLSMIAAQAIPVFASPSVSAEDAAAVSHLEELYKARRRVSRNNGGSGRKPQRKHRFAEKYNGRFRHIIYR